MPEESQESERLGRLHQVIADYLRADRGNADELLAQHPDLADELKEFLALDRRIRDEARSVGNGRGEATVDATTPWGQAAGDERSDPLTFGDYQVIEELGHGGMGVVFKARQCSLNRHVALKVIRAGQLASTEDIRRFYAEAEAAASLDHPHIVEVHDFGEHQGRHYYTMKLIDGGSLAVAIGQGRGKKAEELKWAARLVAQVARAVHHAHQRGILHRDLKPGNILLSARVGATSDNESVPYVTDFGLARRTSMEAEWADGQIEGTPSYMAPEQASGTRQVTTAVDVYGLGAILYEMITGHKPFRAATIRETLEQVRTQEPVPPRTRNPAIARDLEAICRKCLHKDPERRYASAAALADDLERFLDDLPVQARPIGPVERLGKWAKRHPGRALWTALTAATLLGVFIGAVWAWNNERRWREREQRIRYAAQLNLAWEEWRNGHVARVRELLDGLRPTPGHHDLRCFGWWHLWLRCERDLFTLRGHTAPVYGVAFSPEEKVIATASADGTIHLWDPTAGAVRNVLRGHGGIVFAVAFSRDGVLASASADGTVCLWDVTTGAAQATLRSGAETVTGLAFSPDGRILAASAHDGAVTLWDVPGRRRLRTLAGQGDWLTCVAFAPDGKTIATGAVDGTVLHLDVKTGKELPRPPKHDEWVWSVAFSPDGQWLATGGFDQRVRLWDLKMGQSPQMTSGETLEGIAVAFTPDSTVLAVGGRETVLLWDMKKRRTRHVLKGHTGSVNAVRFSPTGAILASADAYGSVHLWEGTKAAARKRTRGTRGIPDGPSQRVLTDRSGPAHCLRFAHGGQLLATAGRSATNQGELVLWETTTWKCLATLSSPGKPIHALAFAPDDATLASGGEEGSVRLWEVATLRTKKPRVRVLKGHERSVTSLAFHPSGKWLASASLDRTIKLWDVAAGALLATLREHQGGVSAVAFSPDGTLLASASYDRTVLLWDVASRQPRARLTGHLDYINGVAFSPDGQNLASGGDDLLVKLWDVRTGRERVTLKGHSGAVWGLTFTPDGQTLATTGDDLTITLWDLSIAQPRIRLDGHRRTIRGVAFAGDGQTMATAGEDGAVIVWHSAHKDTTAPLP